MASTAQLQQQVNTLTAQVASLQATVTQLQSAINAQEAQITTLTAERDQALADLAECQAGGPQPPPPAPTITNATATPSSLPAGGGRVTVNATVANATSVTLDGAAVTLPATVNVTASKALTLVARGAIAPDATASINVTVAAALPDPAPTALTPLWQSVPYSPMTIQYFDSRPTASFTGPPEFRIPWISKHTRGTFRKSDGRLYHGYGDWSSAGTGLPDDTNGSRGSSAHSGFCSMDPLNPGVVRIEQHRWVLDQSQVVPAAGDEGAMTWNDTTDKMIVFPLDAFDEFNTVATVNKFRDTDFTGATAFLVPKFVSPTQCSLLGDHAADLPVGQRFRLHLNHPAFAAFPLTHWFKVPCWVDCRVTAVTASGGSTLITFITRPDIPALAFDRDARAISTGAVGDAPGAWRDNSSIYYDPSTAAYYCGFLEWTPSTRLFARRNFKLGKRLGAVDLPLVGAPGDINYYAAYMSQGNAWFAPASVTGRGDEVICLSCSGPDSGWMGAFHYEYSTNAVNLYVTAGMPTDAVMMALGKDQPCFDPVGKCLYTYAAVERRLYRYDIPARALSVVCTIEHDFVGVRSAANANGSGHCAWNAALGMVEIYADTLMFGAGLPTLYLVDPVRLIVHNLGNKLPNGERIRGDEFHRAGDRTIAEGGEFNPDGTEASQGPPNRHVFIGKALTFSKLAIATMQRVVPVRFDPTATNAKSATTEAGPVWRGWGGPVIEPSTGRMYMTGGAHTEYPGTDQDWCDLNGIANNTMQWTQNLGPPFDTFRRRVHVPPSGDASYGAGGSGYVESDGTDWQVTAQHGYCRDTAHPTLGLLRCHRIPAGLAAPAAGVYPDPAAGPASTMTITGIVSWHPSTLNVARASYDAAQTSAFSDWNTTLNKLLIVDGGFSGDYTRFLEWTPSDPQPVLKKTISSGAVRSPFYGGYAYGWVHWLEGTKYLVSRNRIFGAASMWALDIADYSFVDVTSPSFTALFAGGVDESGGVYTCADRDHRRVWYLIGKESAAPELHYATFDAPGVIVRAPMVDNAQFRPTAFASSTWSHKALQYYGGYLYMPTRSSGNVMNGGPFNPVEFYRMPAY